MALPAPTLRSRDLSGIALAAAGFALLTASDVTFKMLTARYPGYEILTISGLFALLPIFARAHLTGGVGQLLTQKPLMHLVRACAGVLSTLAAIYAYARLQLTDYYAIVFAGPLLVTVLSSFWLGEKIDLPRLCAIAVGFSGVIVVANPFHHAANAVSGGSEVLIGRLAAFVSVFCYSLSVIMVRRMRIGESSMTFVLFGYSVAIIWGMALWLLQETPAMQTADLPLLMLSGLLGSSGTLCVMEAYHRAPTAMVAPFQYTQIFWGAVASCLLWRAIPDAPLIAGATIVAASGLFMLYRDLRAKP